MHAVLFDITFKVDPGRAPIKCVTLMLQYPGLSVLNRNILQM